jgi:ABC-type branched-subunit amino acid transport system substrate-binding protein
MLRITPSVGGRPRWRVACALAVTAAALAIGVSSSVAASKAPIKIGVMETVIPGVYNSATMFQTGDATALGYAAQHGGWGGHHVDFIQCQSPGDAASDTKCYKEFVADKVAAVIGVAANQGNIGLPLLKAAHIADFEISAGMDKWDILVSGGADGAFIAPARYACGKHLKSVSVLLDADPEHEDAEKIAATIYKNCGISVNAVLVPYGTADPSPYIQKAISSSPQLLVANNTVPTATEVNDIAAANWPMSKVVTVFNGDSTFFQQSNTAGITLLSGGGLPFSSDSNADVQTYLKLAKKYAAGQNAAAQLAPAAYQAVTTIWQIGQATSFSKLSGTAIENYMNGKAIGHLKILMGQTVKVLPGVPGNKQPFVSFVHWTGKKLTPLGWYQGEGSCRSVALCTSKYSYIAGS